MHLKMIPPEKGPLAARTRFMLLLLVVLCLMINWANILTFNAIRFACGQETPTRQQTSIR